MLPAPLASQAPAAATRNRSRRRESEHLYLKRHYLYIGLQVAPFFFLPSTKHRNIRSNCNWTFVVPALPAARLGRLRRPRAREPGRPARAESRRDHIPCRFRRSNSSTLNGKSPHTPRSSAPPAAEKTEKLRGAFTPNATVIVRAKVVRRAPLSKATMRVFQPTTRRRPNSVSAAVAIIANAGIVAAGKNQLSVAV